MHGDDLEGIAKVTLLMGNDTLERLDKIVKRGHFGGRGRALDALLDALHSMAGEASDWTISMNTLYDKKSTDEDQDHAQEDMNMRAVKAWGILERFIDLDLPEE